MPLKPANQRVVDALDARSIHCEIQILDQETRTAAAAAETLGCTSSQIAKSLIFATETHQPVLAVTSGSNRVVLSQLAAIIGQQVGKADADFVRKMTGFVIGGVAPVGLATDIETVFDRDLFQHETVWAAAGTPNSLFAISNKDLLRLAGDRIFNFTRPLN